MPSSLTFITRLQTELTVVLTRFREVITTVVNKLRFKMEIKLLKSDFLSTSSYSKIIWCSGNKMTNESNKQQFMDSKAIFINLNQTKKYGKNFYSVLRKTLRKITIKNETQSLTNRLS